MTIAHSTIWGSLLPTTIRDSRVVATDTGFRESSSGVVWTIVWQTLLVERSTAWLIDSDVIGTDGDSYNMSGRPAISPCESTVLIGPGCSILGGYFYGGGRDTAIQLPWQFGRCWPSVGAQLPVFVFDPASPVQWPLGSQNAKNFFDPVPALTWSTSPAQTALATTQYAEPGSLTILAAGTLLPAPLGGIPNLLFLDPTRLQVLDLGFADGAGMRTWTTPIPPTLPLPVRVPLQALELTTGNDLRLTPGVVAGAY